MKKTYLLTLTALLAFNLHSLSQTTLTEDANGILNATRIYAQTSSGQVFFQGHQLGSSYGYPYGIFRALTDNPTGASNYFYDGVANGITNFSVRADGQGYFAGNVGIGTTNPQANLELKAIASYDGTTMLRITNNSNDYGRANLVITGRIENGNDSWNFGSNARNSIVFSENASTTGANIGAIGDEKFSMQLEGNSNSLGFLSKQNGNAPNMVVTQVGNVGIGTTNPQNKLDVNGTIHSKQVNIDLNGWSDYVFNKDYQLPLLKNIKIYIDQNHHLPEIPSEQEIIKNGLNLGEINKLLTKKVEELTLYLIEKDQKDSEQEADLNTQKKINQTQEERISKLEKQLEILTQSLNKN